MSAANLLRMSGVARRFGKTVALEDVSLEVAAGEVHALVGENGAGKSTLMKILTGAEKPDAGSIEFGGQALRPRTPIDALRAGIACVYQEFNLAPHLSVAANLTLGSESHRAGILRGRIDRRRCEGVLRRLGLSIGLDRPVAALGVADQQMIEVARVLLGEPRLIIMDEPTSALATHEVQRLFATIRQLRGQGISIVYISHFLEELPQIADRLTVLRDGRSIATGPMGQWDRGRIIEAMVGRSIGELYPPRKSSIGQPLLELRELAGRHRPRSATLTLHHGEVLGIAGLVGAGRTEMLRTLFGLDPLRGGEALLRGVKVGYFGPAEWTARRVSLLSEDRKSEGLAQQLSSRANISLPALANVSRLGFLMPGRERARAQALGRQLKVKWSSVDQPVMGLSGGNQQKVAMARLLFTDADVLLLDEPTRGIDVGAKADLYQAIAELAGRGKGILMVSSYLPELLGTCDRIAVMSRGALSAAYDVAGLTAESIMHMAVGDESA